MNALVLVNLLLELLQSGVLLLHLIFKHIIYSIFTYMYVSVAL